MLVAAILEESYPAGEGGRGCGGPRSRSGGNTFLGSGLNRGEIQ